METSTKSTSHFNRYFSVSLVNLGGATFEGKLRCQKPCKTAWVQAVHALLYILLRGLGLTFHLCEIISLPSYLLLYRFKECKSY